MQVRHLKSLGLVHESMLHIHRTVTLRRRRGNTHHTLARSLYMHSRSLNAHPQTYTHRADNIISWLYSPVSEAWHCLNLPFSFWLSYECKKSRWILFGWVWRWSRWYFGWLVQNGVCVQTCVRQCAIVVVFLMMCSVCFFSPAWQNVDIGEFCQKIKQLRLRSVSTLWFFFYNLLVMCVGNTPGCAEL